MKRLLLVRGPTLSLVVFLVCSRKEQGSSAFVPVSTIGLRGVLQIHQPVLVPSPTCSTQHFFKNGVDNDTDDDDDKSELTMTHQRHIVQPHSPIVDIVRRRSYETFYWTRDEQTYKINYRMEGLAEDPPIVLIHGFGANIGHFRHQFQDLTRAGYRVYAIDLLGFGASDKPDHVDFSIELFGDLVRDFIREMDTTTTTATTTTTTTTTPQWVVAGNSMGGLCSLQVAKKLGTRVRGVALFNCAPGMSVFRYEDVPPLVRPILFLFQTVVLGPRFGHYFFSRFKTRQNVEAILRTSGVYWDTSKVDDELLETLLEPGNDVGSETVFLKVFGGAPGPTPESILSTLDCPVLGIWGGADPWLPPDKGLHPATEFHKYMKNPKDFELQILPNVGHCPQDEAPQQVNERFITWLQDLPMGTSH